MLNFKIKFIILILFFMSILNAQAIRNEIITSEYVSINGKSFINVNNLKENYYKNIKTDFLYKININKRILKNHTYYLKLECNMENFISISVPYIIKGNFPLIKIDKDTKDSIIFAFDFKKDMPVFTLNIYNEFEYKYIMNEEKILFGIAYGIILCAFLYNFVFFLYNREKSFFYYSILQISLLFALIFSSSEIYIYNLFKNHENIVDFFIIILINGVLIISILFNMEFLNTKKYTPKIHKFLWFLFYLYILDLILLFTIEKSPIFEYVPFHIILSILLFSAFAVLFKGYKPALFYIIGWLSLFVFVFLTETSLSDNNELYLLHIGIPLESLLFSFALGYKVRQVHLEKQRNESILINQSKLASMGEMIGNIAHQWRQPLTHLSYIIMNLKAAYENDKLSDEYFEEKAKEVTTQIEFMSHTIDDFRNFFKISKQKEEFNLAVCINESINLLNESFKILDIKLDFNYEKDFKIKTYRGELSQVIFNLLNNAKEEFIRKEIKNPKLKITFFEKNHSLLIKIFDNAGGINDNIIKKIFEPYFTTKDKGLGIGLYMSKIIIEKNIGGKLDVENFQNGALFTISFPTNFIVK